MTAAAKKESVNLSPRKILSGDLQRAEFSRAHFRVIVTDLETTIDDILKPEYWVNCGATLKGSGQHPFPIIEMIWQDGSRYIELVSIDANNLWAKVKVLRDIDLRGDQRQEKPAAKATSSPAKNTPATGAQDGEGSGEDDGSPLEIKYINQHTKFCVVRKSDGERLNEGLETKEAAQEWIEAYNKSMAG